MKIFNVLKASFTVLVFVGSTAVTAAEEDNLLDKYIPEVYVLNVGLAFKELVLDVYEEGASNTNGTLTEGMHATYHLSINSPYKFISASSRFGYYYEYGLSTFKMNLQNVGSDGVETDLGTSASGKFLYFAPTMFYNFGDSVKLKKKDAYVVGVGAGVGYLQAKGDIIFTETTDNLHAFDISGVEISAVFFFEYQHNDWFYRVQGAGPSITVNDKEYSATDIALIMGYSYRL